MACCLFTGGVHRLMSESMFCVAGSGGKGGQGGREAVCRSQGQGGEGARAVVCRSHS